MGRTGLHHLVASSVFHSARCMSNSQIHERCFTFEAAKGDQRTDAPSSIRIVSTTILMTFHFRPRSLLWAVLRSYTSWMME